MLNSKVVPKFLTPGVRPDVIPPLERGGTCEQGVSQPLGQAVLYGPADEVATPVVTSLFHKPLS